MIYHLVTHFITFFLSILHVIITWQPHPSLEDRSIIAQLQKAVQTTTLLCRDQVAETKWISLLSPYKQKCVHKLLKHKDFISGFDSLLGLPVLFNDGMSFGMIERLLN